MSKSPGYKRSPSAVVSLRRSHADAHQAKLKEQQGAIQSADYRARKLEDELKQLEEENARLEAELLKEAEAEEEEEEEEEPTSEEEEEEVDEEEEGDEGEEGSLSPDQASDGHTSEEQDGEEGLEAAKDSPRDEEKEGEGGVTEENPEEEAQEEKEAAENPVVDVEDVVNVDEEDVVVVVVAEEKAGEMEEPNVIEEKVVEDVVKEIVAVVEEKIEEETQREVEVIVEVEENVVEDVVKEEAAEVVEVEIEEETHRLEEVVEAENVVEDDVKEEVEEKVEEEIQRVVEEVEVEEPVVVVVEAVVKEEEKEEETAEAPQEPAVIQEEKEKVVPEVGIVVDEIDVGSPFRRASVSEVEKVVVPKGLLQEILEGYSRDDSDEEDEEDGADGLPSMRRSYSSDNLVQYFSNEEEEEVEEEGEGVVIGCEPVRMRNGDKAQGAAEPVNKASVLGKRVMIVKMGGNGNIDSYIALANGLVAAGYVVALATHECYIKGIRPLLSPAIWSYPLVGNPGSLYSLNGFKEAVHHADYGTQQKMMLESAKGYMEQNQVLLFQMAREFRPDLLVSGILSLNEVVAIGQKLRTPAVGVCSNPWFPTKEFPPAGGVDLPIKFINPLRHWFSFNNIWSNIGERVERFRKQVLDLPPQKGFAYNATPLLCTFNPFIVPRPVDWPEQIRLTGHWVLETPQDYTPPLRVLEFLRWNEEEGMGVPIYFGYGKVPLFSSKEMLSMFVTVLKKLDRCGIFCTRNDEGDDEAILSHEGGKSLLILKEGEISLDWLLSRCCVAVHEGTSFASHSSFSAGVPTVIFPMLSNHSFWARKAAALKVGPPDVVPVKRLSAITLERQILAALKPDIVENCQYLGENLRSTNGVAHAVTLIGCYIRHYAKRKTQQSQDPSAQSSNSEMEEREEDEDQVVTLGEQNGMKLLVWRSDGEVKACVACAKQFTFKNRRHHCRSCGDIFCGKCVRRTELENYAKLQYVCRFCKRWDDV